MNIFSKLTNRFVPLPKPPEMGDKVKRIYLEEEDLEWTSFKAIQKALRGHATVAGNTVDLHGKCISGLNLDRSGNRDSEKAAGIRINNMSFNLVNGWIDNIPGGIKVLSPYCKFENLIFTGPGEDFLSTVGLDAIGIKIVKCEFWNDKKGDKSIQLNQAKDAVLNGVKIVGGITGIRIQKDSYETPDVTARMRWMNFIGCQTGLNVAGQATVRMIESRFQSVGQKWVTGKGSRVISV